MLALMTKIALPSVDIVFLIIFIPLYYTVTVIKRFAIPLGYLYLTGTICYLDSQRPEAPHGRTSPFEDTGSPISSADTIPLYFFMTVPSM